MKMLMLCSMLAITGCSSFSTTQTDVSYDKGLPLRSVTTKAKARTFFDAKSALTNFKASQTDKTQSAFVGGLNQEATGTNAIGLVEAVSAGATKGALQYLAPKP